MPLDGAREPLCSGARTTERVARARAVIIFLDFVVYASYHCAWIRGRAEVIDSRRRRSLDAVPANPLVGPAPSVRARRDHAVPPRTHGVCVNISVVDFKCSVIYQWNNQMVVLEEGSMLTGHNQYLQPDYLSPLPTSVSILCFALHIFSLAFLFAFPLRVLAPFSILLVSGQKYGRE